MLIAKVYNLASAARTSTLTRLPVIVGFGGINPAGRSSGHHGYRRLVYDQLASGKQQSTLKALAALMQCDANEQSILANTLVRKMNDNLFDPDHYRANKQAMMTGLQDGPLSFSLKKNQLPEQLPKHWTITELDSQHVQVTTTEPLSVLFPDGRASKVNSAGQLPTGFDPEALYQSRSHPRGLQLTVFGASDAVQSLGIPWQTVQDQVPGDQIAVYASSAMGQLDFNGSGGMLQSALLGQTRQRKELPPGSGRDDGRLRQRLYFRQRWRDRRKRRRLRHLFVQPAPGHHRHSSRQLPRGRHRIERGPDHTRGHRRLPDHGCAGRG